MIGGFFYVKCNTILNILTVHESMAVNRRLIQKICPGIYPATDC